LEPKGVTNTTASNGLKVAMVPNPATDIVTITFSNGNTENVSIRVTNAAGVSVYNKSLGAVNSGSEAVPLGKMASGIYMVEVVSGDRKVVQRLVKE
jgi:hypothetical protein